MELQKLGAPAAPLTNEQQRLLKEGQKLNNFPLDQRFAYPFWVN